MLAPSRLWVFKISANKATSTEKIWTQRLALGTVQFGLDYGISNKAGQVEPDQVAAILKHAAGVGLRTLDTASAYGNSERILGEVLKSTDLDFELISKFSAETTAEMFGSVLEQSLGNLSVSSLKAYLAHDFETFRKPQVRERLYQAKEQDKVQQVGVSVYYPEELKWLLEQTIAFDIVQCPFNIFDQRFKSLFPELRARGVEIHTRSSFLQGLFFMNPDELPDYFEDVKPTIATVQTLSQAYDIPLAALLLNFCIVQENIDKVVFGVQSLSELRQNLAAYTYLDACQKLIAELDSFAIADEAILHPGHWPQETA